MRCADPAPVGLELGLARPTRADPAAQARQQHALARRAAAGGSRAARAPPAAGPPGSARAARRCRGSAACGRGSFSRALLEVALLGGRELVVEDHHVGLALLGALPGLLDLAPADERRRDRASACSCSSVPTTRAPALPASRASSSSDASVPRRPRPPSERPTRRALSPRPEFARGPMAGIPGRPRARSHA